MKKLIFRFSIILFLLFLFFITFLSTIGIETNKFNNQIGSLIKNLNKDLEIKLNKVKIILDPIRLELHVKTVGPKLKIKEKTIQLESIKTQISINSLVKNEFSVKDLDISNRSGPNKKETNDEDIKKLLKKMIKQRNESVEIYKKNKREDLLKIEQGEIDLLSTYLPKQLSEEETKKICSEIISKVGAQSIKDMGKVMGELKKNYSDSIDFSKAGSMLKELLNQQ